MDRLGRIDRVAARRVDLGQPHRPRRLARAAPARHHRDADLAAADALPALEALVVVVRAADVPDAASEAEALEVVVERRSDLREVGPVLVRAQRLPLPGAEPRA